MSVDRDRLDPIWLEAPFPRFERLGRDVLTEICVIGGGIAGLSSAYELAKRGHDVTVVDAFGLGSGQTGRTTAHLSTLLDRSFMKLLHSHPAMDVEQLIKAHASAIDAIEHIVESEAIHCDFKRVEGHLFRGRDFSEADLSREREAAAKCGIELALGPSTPLLNDQVSSLKFRDQAQLHPGKFVAGLIRVMLEMGVRFHEGTAVVEIREEGVGGMGMKSLVTEAGHLIKAGQVVIATDTPVGGGGGLGIHLKQHAYRTYSMAFLIEEAQEDCLLWDTEEPYHYVRVAEGTLIVGGQDHRTGVVPSKDPFEALEKWARQNFSFIGEAVSKWSGQVYEPSDQFPFIGKARGFEEGVYIITGLSGSGITGGVFASRMTADLIEGHDHLWAELFDPGRMPRGGFMDFLEENAITALQYKDWLTPSGVGQVKNIPEDSGNVIREGLSKTCVYHEKGRDFEKKSAVCTHLGGIVHWNDIEKTWDCPCHGSRFNVHGKPIEGPATAGLPER